MFQGIFFLLFLYFISPSKSSRIDLIGNDWTIDNHVNYTAQGSVPGTIHTILLAANKIPDPYIGTNDVDLRFLVTSNWTWTFTKNFSLPPDFLASNNISIHLEQIDSVATITINACPIGRTTNMFLRYVFEIASTCLKTENQIQIDFRSPVAYALEQFTAYNDPVLPLCPPDAQKGECHVQFIRKEPCSFSWDWVRIPTFKYHI
jgi:beta-mannosidase